MAYQMTTMQPFRHFGLIWALLVAKRLTSATVGHMSPVEKDHARGLNGALAAEIRAEMGAQEISGHKLADMTGIDRLTLRRYTKGTRGLSTSTIEAIALALKVEPGELMVRAAARRDANPELYGPVSDASDILRAVAKKGDMEGSGEFE